MSTAAWERDRNALNHDWLKNEFTRQLRAFVSRAKAPKPNRARLAEFATQDWPVWAANRERMAALIASAERELSPRQLLDRPPLSRCAPEVKAWLAGLVEALWLARTGIRQQIRDAEAALSEADRRYLELAPLLAGGQSADLGQIRQATGAFRELEQDVEKLTVQLSRLPNRIQVA